jgi:hypothetical protein
VSIALAIALGTAFTNTPFATFVARVGTCLQATTPSC